MYQEVNAAWVGEHQYCTGRHDHTTAHWLARSHYFLADRISVGGCRSDGASASAEGHPGAGQQPPPVCADEEPHVFQPGGGAGSHLLALRQQGESPHQVTAPETGLGAPRVALVGLGDWQALD